MTTYLKSIPSVISGISVTDAYQSALKIMGHDYANKYANYFAKKQKTIKSGKSSFRDSGRQKTYNAEFKTIREYKFADGVDEVKRRAAQFKTLNWKETVKYFNKIAKSKLTKNCVTIELVQMVDTRTQLLLRKFSEVQPLVVRVIME